jgi:hypothetical protein
MSDCGVCITGFDGDRPEMYVETVVTARKAHKCYECEREIQPSEKYERVAGKWDGEMGSYTFCLACSEIQKVFSCNGGRAFGMLWEDMEEYVFPELTTANKCFAKLSAGAKQFVLDRWNSWKFDAGAD